ncbi:MAG TPA: serine hydrolase domain-containing protein [Alphaproteobacteria bacterium]|nr:serine hydrolase domain-containing protein [Alphaproteobacteria bacterium]
MPEAPAAPLASVLDRAFTPVAESLDAGRIPGGALGVVAVDGRRDARCGGVARRTPEPRPLTADTVFDLASLTKVIFTTTEILKLVEEGRIDLDDPIARHIPDLSQYDYGKPTRRFTIRQLLTHQTGLIAVEPIYTWGSDPETLRALILQRDWPVGAPVYSDINFMLLGILLERLRDRALIDFDLPDGLTFRPDFSRCAATEHCGWRGRMIEGEVHDENAYALGGVAGHAGLFGTLDGVLDFAQALMAGAVLKPATLIAMRTSRFGDRILGWQAKHPGWSGGSLCSDETIGHTGFTGTGLWLDFGRGVAWALLTNRVHPSRHVETGIMDLRRAVGNLIAAEWPER